MNETNWKARFFTIWTGQAFSLFGSSLVQFALVWWLTITTGSATVLTTGMLFAMLPQIVLSPFAGVIVDRFSRRAVMLIADSATAIFTLALTYLFAIGAAQVWQVYVIMLIRSTSGVFHFPAMQASTSLMVPEKQLARVAGMNQTLQGLMNVVAPPVGALLVSVLPIYQVTLVDAFTALMAILPLLFIAIPQPKRAAVDTQAAQRTSFLNDLREGFRYVLSWPGLPILITKPFGGAAPQMALMNTVFGVGMIAGGLLLSAWGGFKRRIATSLMGVLGVGLGFVVLGLAPSHWFLLAVGAAFFVGAMSPIGNGPVFAVLQSSIAPHMQGRVMSLLRTGSMGMTPLSLLVAGPIADALGVQVWFVIGGVVMMLVAIGSFFVPALMNKESQKAAHQVTVPEAQPVFDRPGG